eukprot:TRINITY_DN117_c0_g3_i1.p1 TRINITY_DN117_c0_g3~~TRINITY_DN117_c0_g3_i1.p1  ORF type:complete len:298 (-),score=57.59 TRINITY_DN117_c0_g3_i1:184-1008(-)
MAPRRPLRRGQLAAAAAAVAAVVASSSLVVSPAGLLTNFVSGYLPGKQALFSAAPRAEEDAVARVALAATGPTLGEQRRKVLPIGWKRQLMKRMPDSNLNTPTLMRRIVTVLVKNIDEKWRDAPMRTRDIMKEVGLRGRQIKEKEDINKALYMLMAQKVIHKVKQNPIRWEIHEEYRMGGVPRVSWNEKDPWRYTDEIRFKSVKVPRYGPIHGEYRPNKELLTSAPADPKAVYKHIPDTMPEYKPLWTASPPKKVKGAKAPAEAPAEAPAAAEG